MKDVVEDLIEKIQISNEWTSWPCSRLHISKPAEHPYMPANELESTAKSPNDDLLVYASAIITRLRSELEFERREHRNTVEEANHRIEELEAQVAVRETELETRIRLPSQRVFEGDTGSRLPVRKIPTNVRLCPKTLSHEECFRVLESNSARNRSMETEIRGILAKLEEARLAAPSPSGPDNRPEVPQRSAPLSNGNLSHGDHLVRRASPETRTPCASAAPAPSLPPSLPSRNEGELQPDCPYTTHSPDSPSAMLAIVQLDDHICEMSAQLEASKAERKALVAAAARQKRAHNMEDILRIEDECVRLSAQVCHLQQQMDKAKADARSREEELLKAIEVLQSRVRRSSSPLFPVDASIAEESMELATPLQPTMLLSIQNHNTPPEPIDPSLIPLPFSPVRTSSPTFSPRCVSSQSPTPADIQRVEGALTTARENLAQKENALAQLRMEVEDLR
ncbi:hypothetical protein M404DRAFT_308389 [Pisolithus tinctorius Marx 270]|uniref:Uncharacterized protein n=1 Tax=Pisolithus tinctorius Marx 270 TaxID=870435 RepID=A0A0C3KHW5_PISTI|nr:hypothetical protein M404DRAFT_308389 [Pisolithus tinctorius Marx 270]